MLVEKKVGWLNWYIVSMFTIVGFFLVFNYLMLYITGYQLVDLFDIESLKLNLLIAFILSAYFLITGYISVFLVMWFGEKKKMNFYTSKRFKSERRVLLVLIGLIALLCVLLILLDAFNNNISIYDTAYTLSSIIMFAPIGVYSIYYMLYQYAFVFGVRKKYYDDSLDD